MTSSNQLLSPKIVVIEDEPTVAPIVGSPTSITGFVGVTERGPVAVATLVQSFPAYKKIFGGFAGGLSDVAVAAQSFFTNGGNQLWVSRVTHFTDVTDPSSSTAVIATVTVSGIDGITNITDLATINGKTPGTYANSESMQVTTEAAVDGVSSHFNVVVEFRGRIVEVWPNLSMNSADLKRYAPGIINDPNTGSDYIQFVDDANDPAAVPTFTTWNLASGTDGLASLADADFAGGGNVSGPGGTGLRALDTVQNLRLFAVPAQATAAIHTAMVNYAEAVRFGSCFGAYDPPAGLSASAMVTYVTTTASLVESTEYGAIFWPRVQISNPSVADFGNGKSIVMAPSGAFCGICSRNDAAQPGGVYEAPAGYAYGRIMDAIGLETDEVKDESKRDLTAPALINNIVGLDGLPIHIDGSNTLKTTGDFPTIGERRGVIYIEQSVKTALVFSKHRKIKPSLLAATKRAVDAFLLIQCRNDAFASDVPAQAYNTDFSGAINTPADALAKTVNGRVGIATAKPMQFAVIRVGQDTSALEASLVQMAQAA